MFKDVQRNTVWNEIRQHDLRSFSGQLTPGLLAEAAKRSGLTLGENALNLANLAWLGISCAMYHTYTFAMLLTSTLHLLEDQQGFSATRLGRAKKAGQRKAAQSRKAGRKTSKHDPRRADPTKVSEEAFTQARQQTPASFWVALIFLLAEQFQKDHRQHLQVGDFRLLALDGTTWALENWQALRDYYGTPKNGTRK